MNHLTFIQVNLTNHTNDNTITIASNTDTDNGIQLIILMTILSQ